METRLSRNSASMLGAVVALLLAASGCERSSYAQSGSSAQNSGSRDAGAAPSGSTDLCMAPNNLGDAQIAGVVLEANSGEVHEGTVGLAKYQSTEVRDLARVIVRDHLAGNEQLLMTMQQLGLKAQDSPLRRRVSSMGEEEINEFWAQPPGAEFDRTFVEGEITGHQQTLDLLEDRLIPAAQAPALKQLLQNTRDVVRGHLEQAQAVAQRLGVSEPQ
jgi:putative membrane protein